MKSTIYANIFIEHLDAVRMFKLLNVLKTEELLRFMNSFSDAFPLQIPIICECGEGKTPYGSFQIHFYNVYFFRKKKKQ